MAIYRLQSAVKACKSRLLIGSWSRYKFPRFLVFPRNVTKDQKSYKNLLTTAKETSWTICRALQKGHDAVTACPALTFRFHFYCHAKKNGNDHCCTHSWQRLKSEKCVKNNWETLQCILKHSNSLKMYFTLQKQSHALFERLFQIGRIVYSNV